MMPPTQLTNFFALVRDSQTPVRRILLTHTVQQTLTNLFASAASRLTSSDLERIPFEGSYRPEEGEVMYIEGFEVPGEVWSALREPTACEELVFNNEILPNIRAIFTGSAEANWVSLQAFQRSQFLTRKGVSIILSGKTFKRLEEPGLTVGEEVHAHYQDGALFFRSYFDARRTLDLAHYYREATDTDVKNFMSLPTVHFANPALFEQNADSWVRRKVALIQDRGILSIAPPSAISTAAKSYGLQLDVIQQNGTDVLRFPDAKKELKAILKFLDEDYYTGVVSGQKYVSNSKRTI